VAKTDQERRQVLASIGPVWDGNEVWLIAAGGTLYFAFPTLYASAFSGFYLPLMIVLWLLILRGASIEFRNHIKSAVWDPLWDFLFCYVQLAARGFFRGGARQRGARCAAGFERLFLRTAVDQFPPRRRDRHPRLVHDAGRSIGPARADDARWTVGTDEDQRRSPCACGKTSRPGVVGVAALTALVTAVTFPIQPQVKEISRLAVGIRFSSDCGAG